jgi:hypothetical protein
MNTYRDAYEHVYHEQKFEEIDREVARLASICRVRVLDVGVIERVLRNDDSVCGTANPMAFDKLRDLLMLYFAVREKTADRMGQTETAIVENHVIERLRRVFPDMGSAWPPK